MIDRLMRSIPCQADQHTESMPDAHLLLAAGWSDATNSIPRRARPRARHTHRARGLALLSPTHGFMVTCLAFTMNHLLQCFMSPCLAVTLATTPHGVGWPTRHLFMETCWLFTEAPRGDRNRHDTRPMNLAVIVITHQ